MDQKSPQRMGEYLDSAASASVLGDDSNGWFGPTGIKSLIAVANIGPAGDPHWNEQPDRQFGDLFICDPKAKHHGYKSWDEFFTRHFREGVRPVASPDDDLVIANPCESTPYRTSHNVSQRDRFWIKGQPYSVHDMLANSPLSPHFVGGTVYQAFLSALSYHRWHSPVSGKIKKISHMQGTYFSEPLFEGFSNPDGPSKDGEGPGQAYISAVATRVAIFIESDEREVGLVCVLQIGMVEVSSCDVTVEEGQSVKKGDEIGMVGFLSCLFWSKGEIAVRIRLTRITQFHYGGSSFCIMFSKGVDVRGFPTEQEHNVPVRAELARVKPKEKGT